MPQIRKRAFIWIPRKKTTAYSIEISGVDVTRNCISSEWTRAIVGLESQCKLTLVDASGTYADTYTGGEVIELKLDFSDGSTSQWKGKLDRPKRKFGNAYTLEVIGSHYQSDLLNTMVTEEYTGNLSYDNVVKDLVDSYLTGYTYTNVLSFTGKFEGSFDNKPFHDCILDVCDQANADCYIDSNKDFHFFPRESLEITADAIVWGDNLLEVENLGTDELDVKNRIKIEGEDANGLPVVYETYSGAGDKELYIKDTSIKTYEQAKKRGDAELSLQQAKATKGEVTSLILPDLFPGGMIWITYPPQKVHGQYRLVKYTHYLPNEQTKVVVAKDSTIPQIFRDRKKTELKLAKSNNPYRMTGSYNLTFDDYANINTTTSETITLSNSKLSITSATGTMITLPRVTSSAVTQIHLKVVGEGLSSATFSLSTDGGDTYQTINLETLTSVTSGTSLVLKVYITSSTTLIDSIALLYK